MSNLTLWRNYTRDLESPSLFIDWGFYLLIGAALQRRVWYHSDAITGLPDVANSIFMNNFVVLTGPPACGKGRVIKQLIKAIDHPLLQRKMENGQYEPIIHTAPEKITCEALIEAMAAKGTVSVPFSITLPDGKVEKRVTAQSPCTFYVEELEVLFTKNASDMVSVLNQCFDSGNLRYETKNKGKFNAKNVCVNMIAGTTPSSMRKLVNDKIVQTGFTSRIIPVFAPKPRFYRNHPGHDAQQAEDFLTIVRHIKELATKTAGCVKMSAEAKEFFDKTYESGEMMDTRPNTDPLLDDYYGRKRIHWQKLSALFHFADKSDSYEVPVECVKAAYEFLNATEKEMHQAYHAGGRNELYDVAKSMTAYVRQHKEVRYKKLWLAFSVDVTKAELDETLLYLVSTEQLTNTNQSTVDLEKGIFVMPSKKD